MFVVHWYVHFSTRDRAQELCFFFVGYQKTTKNYIPEHVGILTLSTKCIKLLIKHNFLINYFICSTFCHPSMKINDGLQILLDYPGVRG